MSLCLPIIEPRPKYVADLLREQQELTAVERFSRRHAAEEETEPAQARYYRDLLPVTTPGIGEQFAFEVDLDLCTGCKSCVVACHTLNGLDETEAWRRVGTVSSGVSDAISGEAISSRPLEWLTELPRTDNHVPVDGAYQEPSIRIQHVTTACHHCAEPGCLSGCPVNAYEKDAVTGIVRHLDDQCIGCKYCTMMCPYEVPRYSDRLGIVRKCDMCTQRLAVGEAPACVQACPNSAIAIRITSMAAPAEECQSFAAEKSPATTSRLAPGAPDSRITRPTTIYKTAHPDWFGGAMPQDRALDPVAEAHVPLAWLLVATQFSVGLLLCERIAAGVALLVGIPWAEQVPQLAALGALLLAGAGLGVAPLHLGQPLRAWRIFLGLRTSWLSREAVVLGQYAGLLGLVVLLVWSAELISWLPVTLSDAAWLASLPDGIVPLLQLTTIATGLAGLYCSAQIYIVTRRHLWRASRTVLRCLGTMLLGGLASLSVVLCLVDVLTDGDLAVPFLPITLFLLMLIALVKVSWEYRIQLSKSVERDEYDRRSRILLLGPLRLRVLSRFVLAGVGLGGMLLTGLIISSGGSAHTTSVAFTGTAFFAASALLAGEFLERILYFSSVVYDRMPGTLK